MRSRVLIPVALFVTLVVTPLAAQGPIGGQTAADRHKSGHSKLGEAFDEGPRERPAKIDGIGRTSFPITTSKPEVQEWFDQGHTLLHSFWFFEAERSFRWAVKLDPDAPMPYWGLARTASGDRARAFLREASSRKARGTPRERDYIEAWEVQYEDGAQNGDARKDFHRALERLIIKYPDDVEAKALYALRGDGREPRRHGAAHPAGPRRRSEPPGRAPLSHPQLGRRGWRAGARRAAKQYGTLVPAIGHALHMPGHIYAGLGMYHEAAISLDSATRAEIAYMVAAHGVPVQHLELRPQPQLPQLRAGAARAAVRGHPRRPRAPGRPARSEAERRHALQPALARRGGTDARPHQVRAVGRHPRGGIDPVGHVVARSSGPQAMPRRSPRSRRRIRAADIAVGELQRSQEGHREAGELVVQAAVRGAAPRTAGDLRAQERRRDQGPHAAHRGGAEGDWRCGRNTTIRRSSRR